MASRTESLLNDIAHERKSVFDVNGLSDAEHALLANFFGIKDKTNKHALMPTLQVMVYAFRFKERKADGWEAAKGTYYVQNACGGAVLGAVGGALLGAFAGALFANNEEEKKQYASGGAALGAGIGGISAGVQEVPNAKAQHIYDAFFDGSWSNATNAAVGAVGIATCVDVFAGVQSWLKDEAPPQWSEEQKERLLVAKCIIVANSLD